MDWMKTPAVLAPSSLSVCYIYFPSSLSCKIYPNMNGLGWVNDQTHNGTIGPINTMEDRNTRAGATGNGWAGSCDYTAPLDNVFVSGTST